MKIALYIEDDYEQIVLTPQSDTEKAILGKLHDHSRALDVKRGSFYTTRGGWVRNGAGEAQADDQSTMLILRPLDR